jgi:hypothetical protein
VHLTLGILRTSQAVFYALSFFWLDGFAVPAPAQVTQTVGFSKRFGQPIKVVFFSGQPGANKVDIFCKRFGKL